MIEARRLKLLKLVTASTKARKLATDFNAGMLTIIDELPENEKIVLWQASNKLFAKALAAHDAYMDVASK